MRLHCPLCGKGKVFRGWFEIQPACSHCGWEFQREDGYFLGSIYVNYTLAALGTALLWLLLRVILDWPSTIALPLAAGFLAGFSAWFLRYARAVWMYIDLLVDQPLEGSWPAPDSKAQDPSET